MQSSPSAPTITCKRCKSNFVRPSNMGPKPTRCAPCVKEIARLYTKTRLPHIAKMRASSNEYRLWHNGLQRTEQYRRKYRKHLPPIRLEELDILAQRQAERSTMRPNTSSYLLVQRRITELVNKRYAY